MIIGITGNNGSGKDTFANYLVDNKGFIHISLSDFIREETIRRGLAPGRHSYHEVGNEMREKSGPGILASLALDKMDESRNYVVTSIRSPFEVKKLEKAGSFVLVAVDAPIEVRFARIVERNRKNEKEILGFEEFKRYEEAELKSQLSSSQQIGECIKMAKFSVDNNCDIKTFTVRVEAAYAKARNYLRQKHAKNRRYRRHRSWQNYLGRVFGF